MPRTVTALLCLPAALALAACSGGGGSAKNAGTTAAAGASTPAPADGSTGAIAELAPPSTTGSTLADSRAIASTTSSEPQYLPSGRNFGYIRSFTSDTTAEFDRAEFLTGEDADKAAAEDGVIRPGERAPSDPYIRNPSQQVRSIRMTKSTTVTLVDCSGGCKSVRADLAALRARPMPVTVWISMVKDFVVAVDEYQP